MKTFFKFYKFKLEEMYKLFALFDTISHITILIKLSFNISAIGKNESYTTNAFQ